MYHPHEQRNFPIAEGLDELSCLVPVSAMPHSPAQSDRLSSRYFVSFTTRMLYTIPECKEAQGDNNQLTFTIPDGFLGGVRRCFVISVQFVSSNQFLDLIRLRPASRRGGEGIPTPIRRLASRSGLPVTDIAFERTDDPTAPGFPTATRTDQVHLKPVHRIRFVLYMYRVAFDKCTTLGCPGLCWRSWVARCICLARWQGLRSAG